MGVSFSSIAERDGPKVEVKDEVEEPEEEVKPKKGKKPAKKVEEDEEEDQSEEKEDEDDEEAKERKAAAAKKAEEEAAKQREWASLSEEERAIRKEKEEMARLMLDIPLAPKQYAISLDTLTQNRPFTDDQVRCYFDFLYAPCVFFSRHALIVYSSSD